MNTFTKECPKNSVAYNTHDSINWETIDKYDEVYYLLRPNNKHYWCTADEVEWMRENNCIIWTNTPLNEYGTGLSICDIVIMVFAIIGFALTAIIVIGFIPTEYLGYLTQRQESSFVMYLYYHNCKCFYDVDTCKYIKDTCIAQIQTIYYNGCKYFYDMDTCDYIIDA